MRDLSLHILDLAQNSLVAGAALVRVSLTLAEDASLTLVLEDDGRGMDEEMLLRAQSPFGTTRTTRKVGLGIPLLMESARRTGGSVRFFSKLGEGTRLEARFHTDSVDCVPLGDLAATLVSLISARPEDLDLVLRCQSTKGECAFDTREIRRILDGVPLSEPEVIAWMLRTLREEIESILGGYWNENTGRIGRDPAKDLGAHQLAQRG